MAVKDPYAVPAAGFKTPNFTFPSHPKEPGNAGFQMSPEELDKLLAAGYTIYEDGSIAPPAGQAPAGDEALPPPPEMAKEASTWDNPIFGAHMAIRNPAPVEADPIGDMQKQQKKFMKGDEPKPSVMVSASPLPTPEYTQPEEPKKMAGSQSMMQNRMGKRMGQQPLPPRGGRRG